VRALDIPEGGAANAGDPVVELGADQNHVWEALRGLYLVGTPADAEDVERFTRPAPGMPETVVRQAGLTLQAIRARSEMR
jgi:hypothetical protein